MNSELLTLRRLTAGLIYQPIALQTVDLNRLYAVITESYPYQALQHLPDGVRMANANNDCFIQQARMQINEEVMYFAASKEKCLDIFRMVTSKLGMNQFLTFGIKLTAFMPMEGDHAAAKFIESRALAVRPEEWDILGAGRQGTGLRIVLHKEGIHELRIEPFFSDPTQLYVELDVQHPEPFIGLESLDSKMEAAYNYLFEDVRAFLDALK